MLTIKVLHRANATVNAHYYTKNDDDYYKKDATASVWQGKAAQALGLVGHVESEVLKSTLQGNFGPDIVLSRSIRKDAGARAAIDLTFSPPKSVSIQALVGKDHDIIKAHDQAVAKALAYLEKDLARGRTKVKGVTTSEKTGNIAVAAHRHETARPTQNDYSDPQLHTHALVLNITQRSDGAWVSLSNDEIFSKKALLDAIYAQDMSKSLQKLGYELRYEGGTFELAHISRDQIEVYSKRSMDITDELEKMGLDRQTASRELKQAIALATRKDKHKEISGDELRADWERQAKECGIDFSKGRTKTVPELAPELGEKTIPQAPDLAPQDSGTGEASPSSPGPSLTPEDHAPAELTPEQSDETAPRIPPGHDDKNIPDPAPAYTPGPGKIQPPGNAAQPVNFVADEAVRWAIKHLSERESVMLDNQILESAMKRAIGTGVDLEVLQKAVDDAVLRGHLIRSAPVYQLAAHKDGHMRSRQAWIDRLVKGKGMPPQEAAARIREAIVNGELVRQTTCYTTQEAREREKRILQIERDGREKVQPVMDAGAAQAALQPATLAPGQLDAATLILSTPNRVVGIQGLAGTGKSHMLKNVKEEAERAGYKVQAVASYGMQIKALRELGVKARTIASVVEAQQKDRFKLDDKTILVVDEAGVVASRNMEKLLQMAEKAGARVVLLGDTEQTKAIEAGRPFHLLQDAGMPTAQMKEIQRQKDPDLKLAVELAAKGKSSSSLSILRDNLQSVKQVKTHAIRYRQIADRFASLDEQERAQTLILTGTNKSRNALNTATHRALGLEGKGFEVKMLTRRDTTQAERRQAMFYVTGDIIQPERSYARSKLRQDAQYRIESIDSKLNRLTVVDLMTQAKITFNPARTTKLSVFEPVEAELSAGDKVRITRQDAGRDLANGERFDVLAVTPTTLTIGSETKKVTYELGSLPIHIDRAYATTAHSAQGLTCDRALINAESFTRTTKQDTFYVGISRAKFKSEIFTDNLAELPAAISRREEKSAAIDIGMDKTSTNHDKQKSASMEMA